MSFRLGTATLNALKLGTSDVSKVMLGAVEVYSSFSPLQLSPALWLDATDATTLFDATTGGNYVAPDGAVARWEDKSGNGRHATQGTLEKRPSRKITGISGFPSLDFALGSLSEIAVDNVGFSGRNQFTVLIVHQYDNFLSSGPGWEMLGGHNLGGDQPYAFGALLLQRRGITNQIGVHNAGVQDTGIFINTGSVESLKEPRVSMAQRSGGSELGNGGTVKIRSNALKSTGTQTWNTNQNSVRYQIGGRQQSITNYFDGMIGEIILFSRAITVEEESSLYQYLSEKWNIPT